VKRTSKRVPILSREQNRDVLLRLLQSLADERDRLGIKTTDDPLRDLLELLELLNFGPATGAGDAINQPPISPKIQ